MSHAAASSPGPASEHSVAVPGGTIYYRTQGSGPPLVLIGGGPSNADTLTALAGQLTAGHTVIIYDRRGYSRSTLPRSPPRSPSTPTTSGASSRTWMPARHRCSRRASAR